MRFFPGKHRYLFAPLAFFLAGFLPETAARPAPPPESVTTTVAPAPSASPRWTAATPDAMASQAVTRALSAKGAAVEREAVATMALLMKLADRASYGHARGLLEALARAPSLGDEARGEA